MKNGKREKKIQERRILDDGDQGRMKNGKRGENSQNGEF
jgi:hypothetical protein